MQNKRGKVIASVCALGVAMGNAEEDRYLPLLVDIWNSSIEYWDIKQRHYDRMCVSEDDLTIYATHTRALLFELSFVNPRKHLVFNPGTDYVLRMIGYLGLEVDFLNEVSLSDVEFKSLMGYEREVRYINC